MKSHNQPLFQVTFSHLSGYDLGAVLMAVRGAFQAEPPAEVQRMLDPAAQVAELRIAEPARVEQARMEIHVDGIKDIENAEAAIERLIASLGKLKSI